MSLLDDALARARRRFVGRTGELDRFRSLLSRSEPRVWWVFGPGGIGKSRLLEALADEATAAGYGVALADLRVDEPSPSGLIEAMGSVLEGESGSPVVVMIDSLERAASLERWVRTDLLGLLPSQSIAVIGSRHAPSGDFRADPALSALLELVPLRGLSAADGQELLASAGVAADLVARGTRLTGGHPLALQLLADVILSGEHHQVPDELGAAPDLVAMLLARIVDDVPDDDHRFAVHVAALSRHTTRSLLQGVCDPDRSDELFDWLAVQPWIDRVAEGLCPHDLVRDVIEFDLRSNDPDRYAAIKGALHAHILDPQRLRTQPDRSTTDLLFLQRGSSLLSSYWHWPSFGNVEATPVRPDERAELVDFVARFLRPAELPIVDHWLEQQPHAFTLVRSLDEIVGFNVLLTFDEPTSVDLEVDPTVAAIWRRVVRQGPPRRGTGEVFGLFRYHYDRERGLAPRSPTYNVTTLRCTRHWLTTAGLTLDYIVFPKVNAGQLGPMMDYVDFHRVADADHLVVGLEMVAYEHDWRAVTPLQWLARMAALELGEPVVPDTNPTPVLVALEEADFADAVRAALRDLSRPARLGANPLIGSRVVRDADVADGAEALRQTLAAAFTSLDDDPRTDKARRAVERTYFHGAVTQEAAAEVLGMAFSTYRRHLAAGVDLLIDVLWRWELYGREA